MNIIDEALKVAARAFFVLEEVPDDVFEMRFSKCQQCEHFDPDKEKCKDCGCYMRVKAKAKVHKTLRRPHGEVTHCPKAKWSDEDQLLIEFYQKQDAASAA